eukprot:scaffold209439_cov19-Tisochrysis_lutea.AAC.1
MVVIRRLASSGTLPSGGNRRLLSPSEEPPHLKSGSSGRPKSLLFSSSSRFNTASDKQVFIEGAMCSAKLYGLLYKYLPYNTVTTTHPPNF